MPVYCIIIYHTTASQQVTKLLHHCHQKLELSKKEILCRTQKLHQATYQVHTYDPDTNKLYCSNENVFFIYNFSCPYFLQKERTSEKAENSRQNTAGMRAQ